MDRNDIHVTTADLNQPADLKLDIEETGLENGSYDIIICNHVLEHVDDFRKALKEMYRILTPGGSFICSFPTEAKGITVQ
jgi:ubiquinone/menaquinone biosynthesis C-methylase UbiE